jgi:DNA-binding beta-propeller fold protein YncE
MQYQNRIFFIDILVAISILIVSITSFNFSSKVLDQDSTPTNKSNQFLRQWSSEGTGEGQFNGSAGIAVDSLNSVYVVDSENGRIQKFDSNGTLIKA